MKFLLAHGSNLADPDRDLLCIKSLEVRIENLVVRLAPQIGACREHRLCEGFDLNSCSLRKFLGRRPVHRRAGRGTENQGIRQDRAAQKPGDFFRDIDAVLMIHLVNDRRRASYRLIAEKYRIHGLQGTQPVMIDNFKNLRVVHIVDRLGYLIVVHQDQLPLAHAQQVPAGNHADIAAMLVQDREITVTLLGHDLPDLIRIIRHAEGDQSLALHEKIDRHSLVDQPGNRIGIQRTDNHGRPVFLRHMLDRTGNGGSQTYHDASCACQDRHQLRFIAVSQDHHISFIDIVLHYIRIRGCNDYLPAVKIRIRIPYDHLRFQGLKNVPVGRFCHGDDTGVIFIHVGFCDIVDRNYPFQAVLFPRHRKRNHILCLHQIPCVFHGNLAVHSGSAVNLHIFDTGSDIVDIERLLKMEIVQNILRFP